MPGFKHIRRGPSNIRYSAACWRDVATKSVVAGSSVPTMPAAGKNETEECESLWYKQCFARTWNYHLVATTVECSQRKQGASRVAKCDLEL